MFLFFFFSSFSSLLFVLTLFLFSFSLRVTPLTNLTFWDLEYQLYLNYIFHREWVSFLTHSITMPSIIFSLMAAAAQVRLSDDTQEWATWIDLSFLLVLFLFVWYASWGILSKRYWLPICAIPILAVTYIGGHYYHYSGASETFNPLWLTLIFSELQSWSHFVEDLPPRVNIGIVWTTKRDFFCRPPGSPFLSGCLDPDGNCRFTLFLIARGFRALLQAFIFGAIDELLASPRLLALFWSAVPYRKLSMMFCDVDPFAEWYRVFARSLEPQDRAESETSHSNNCCVVCCNTIATNPCVMKICCPGDVGVTPKTIPNPALDYIGVGGGVYARYYRDDAHQQDMTVGDVCCNCTCAPTPRRHVGLDAQSARKNICAICPSSCAPALRNNEYHIYTGPSDEDIEHHD